MQILSRAEKAFFCLFAIVIVFLGTAVYLSKHGVEQHSNYAIERRESAYTIEIKKEKTFAAALESDPVAFFTKWLFIATGFLMLFTAGLAVVTIMIWLDSKETSRKQHVASRRSLIHAAKNSRAAEMAAIRRHFAPDIDCQQ